MRNQDATTLGELSSNEGLQPLSDIVKDAGAWAASFLALTKLLEKLKEHFPKRKGSKRTPEELGEEIDDLLKVIDTLMDVIRKHVEVTDASFKSLEKLVTVLGDKDYNGSLVGLRSNVGKIAQIVVSHDAQLIALEKAMPK